MDSSVDNRSREEIILSLKTTVEIYARVVRETLPLYLHNQDTFDILVQQGWVGAIKAVDRWDRKRSLLTFCKRHIKGHMLDYLREEDPLSRLDRSRVKAGLLDKKINMISMTENKQKSQTQYKDCRAGSIFHRILDHTCIDKLSECKNLTARQRLAIDMYFFQDLSCKQIGKKLKIGESGSYLLIQRALLICKKFFNTVPNTLAAHN